MWSWCSSFRAMTEVKYHLLSRTLLSVNPATFLLSRMASTSASFACEAEQYFHLLSCEAQAEDLELPRACRKLNFGLTAPAVESECELRRGRDVHTDLELALSCRAV
eukprot:s3455_g8.t1